MPTPRELILSSLIADSLALGAHWEYDQKRIQDTLGTVETLLAPRLTNYHTTREAGDLSHYGDQVLLLLQTVYTQNSFVLEQFASAWQKYMADYDGYMDHASRDTLRHFSEGASPTESGGQSNDFSGAARIAPLFATYEDDLEQLIIAARAQTLMTHNNGLIADGAEFFARTTFALLNGAPIKDALEVAAESGYAHLPAEDWLAFTYLSADEAPLKAIEKFGQSCGMKGAFHGVIHLVTTMYETPHEALIANVMAGGDSCARGLMLGLLFGAIHGSKAYREQWLTGLRCRDTVISLTTS